MKRSLGLIFSVMLLLAGCSQWDDLVDSITGSDDDAAATTTKPTTPATTKPTTPTKTKPTTPTTTKPTTPDSKQGKKEYGTYDSRTNGDRPTWRWSKKMGSFPSTFWVTVDGCGISKAAVKNNGRRFEGSGLVVKQSDVSGRGMAILAPSSCHSRTCYVSY